jgi:short-subunit dehydrogenase
LGASGARLILSGRDEKALVLTARDSGGEARLLPFDLEDAAACENASNRALGFFGGLDFVILNAGISQRSVFVNTSKPVFERIMRINFDSSVEITRTLLPSMLRRKSGSIICVSSLAGLMGAPLRSAYSASKHALAGFFSSLRTETGKSGVKIYIVYPGFINTMISRNALKGDGSRHDVLDPFQKNGLDPASAARKIVKSIVKGRLDIRVAMDPKARLALFMSRNAPWLAAKALSRQVGL